MKKIKGSENALLTFGVLVPVGALGALVCLLVLVIMSIFGVLTFIFLLLCGFSSLIYGYLNSLRPRDVIKVDVELSQIAMPHRGTIGDSHIQIIGDHLYVIGEGLTVSRVGLCDDEENRGSARIVMEYCCTRADDFRMQDNATIRSKAIDELEKMGLATSNDIMAMRVRRLDKAI